MGAKPRVVYVVHNFPPEVTAGTELHTLWLAHGLSRNYDIYVFTRTPDPKMEEYSVRDETFQGLKVRRVKVTNSDWVNPSDFYLNSRIDRIFAAYLDQVQPSLVHIHHTVGLSAGIVEEAVARGIPTILQLRDFFYMCEMVHLRTASNRLCDGPLDGKKCAGCIAAESKPHLPRDLFNNDSALFENAGIDRTKYMKTLLTLPDIVIAPSAFVKEKFLEFGVPPSKMLVSPDGVRTWRLAKRRRKRPHARIVFGYLGNIFHHKGLHTLIEAFRTLDQKKSELEIYGEARDTELARNLKMSAKNLRVKFKGAYSERQLPTILSNLDVLVHPSIVHESYSMVIHEALGAKVPVIVSDIPAQKDAVRNNLDGFHFHVEDSQDLARKMRLMTENPQKLMQFRRNIPAVRSITDQVQDFRKLYRKSIRGPRRDADRNNLLTKLRVIRQGIDTKTFQFLIGIRQRSSGEAADFLKTLLVIYDSRLDLQEAFPEVRSGDLDGLINWAFNILRGRSSDSFDALASSASRPLFSSLQTLGNELQLKEAELVSIKSSVGYRLTRFYGGLIDYLFPDNTMRGRFKKRVKKRLLPWSK